MQTSSSVGSAAQMAEYRLSPAAERDLEGIWKYTRQEWGLEQAERYTDLLSAAFQVLAEHCECWPTLGSPFQYSNKLEN